MVNTEIILIIFFAAKDGEALYSQQKTRPGTDCGSDHELLITKFRLKLKKVGKTTREGNDTPLQYSCLEISMDRGAWWASVHGIVESDTTEQLHFYFSLLCIGEGSGNLLQCSCLENPGTREPGGLLSMGSHRVGHD